jgi:inosine-uridine nucleoside N-ribohydrolase
MLLGWDGVDVVGITTSTDPGGQRAGYVHELLRLAAHEHIPVAAGAAVCLATRRPAGEVPDGGRYWGMTPPPSPSAAGAALDLLSASIDAGATVVAIGPFTNLAMLEVARTGRLAAVPVVTMGGWRRLPPDGLPPWGPEMDWNVQSDTMAAEIVFGSCDDLTVVGVDVTVQVHLRSADLDRLRSAGPVGAILARSSAAHGEDYDNARHGRAFPGLPDDLVNYHHDPLACAVALGWDGVTTTVERLAPVLDDGVLRLDPSPDGRPMRTVTAVDGPAFAETWLSAVERLR